jgi:hypothetical protein
VDRNPSEEGTDIKVASVGDSKAFEDGSTANTFGDAEVGKIPALDSCSG